MKILVISLGWNNLKIVRDSKLLKGLDHNTWAYFVHSYYIKPKNRKIIVAKSDYGLEFPAIIESKKLFGTQFHPEKSGDVGMIMLRNFLRECEK